MDFGSCYHKFREVYEYEGETIESAFETTMELWKELIGIDPVVGTRSDHLTKAYLIKACMVGAAYRDAEAAKGRVKVIASEQPVDIYLKDGKTRRGGLIDQSIMKDGKLTARDFKASSKTADYWNRMLGPNDQASGYILCLAKLSQSPVEQLIFEVLHLSKPTKSKPNNTPTIQQYIVKRSKTQLARWEDEQIVWEGMIDQCRDTDFWPMADETYSHCMYCEFRMLCDQTFERGIIGKIEQYYTQEIWDYKNMHGEKLKGEEKKGLKDV